MAGRSILSNGVAAPRLLPDPGRGTREALTPPVCSGARPAKIARAERDDRRHSRLRTGGMADDLRDGLVFRIRSDGRRPAPLARGARAAHGPPRDPARNRYGARRRIALSGALARRSGGPL